MTEHDTSWWDVVVIGAGPSGLAAATELKRLGVEKVLLLERENQAGGIPRHCGHSPFGMREFRKVMYGPTYARRLVERAESSGVRLVTGMSVVSVAEGGCLTVTSDDGMDTLKARRVIACTGVRETPRSARLVSGQRPRGILTTGALQSLVYLTGNTPFNNALVVGTELVSFSALLTCRHGDIRPLGMIEENNRITAPAPLRLLAGSLGVPIWRNTRLSTILGKNHVEGIELQGVNGRSRRMDCDGVIFTGRFTPESSLLRSSGVETDRHTGGPVVDQFGRCSTPGLFAAGNLLRGVETAGWCWNEGRRVARCVAASLDGRLNDSLRSVHLSIYSPVLRYVVPQRLAPEADVSVKPALNQVQMRVSEPTTGRLFFKEGNNEIWGKSVSKNPERRLTAPLPEVDIEGISSMDVGVSS